MRFHSSDLTAFEKENLASSDFFLNLFGVDIDEKHTREVPGSIALKEELEGGAPVSTWG